MKEVEFVNSRPLYYLTPLVFNTLNIVRVFEFQILKMLTPSSLEKRKITLSDIYSWILDNFPYYKDAGNGWKVIK